MSDNNRRRRVVADKSIQWQLARRVILHFLVFIAAAAFFGFLNQFLADPFLTLREHVGLFWKTYGTHMLALVCLLPVFVRDTLKISNRIVGPICNLRRTVQEMAEGQETRPLKFRKGDMWSDLPESFNKMVERLRNSSAAD